MSLKAKITISILGGRMTKYIVRKLVWKIYSRSMGIEIGNLKTLKEFDLNNAIVKNKLIERYGDNIPLNEIVISPGDMFESDLLETVYSKEW
ncbi:hypothetical protein [Pelosinus baikalensis]|uniref:Uncharacterized protein n=1 Tax=Pelosinus baikalensis TaxID=2892015 RepID=A0ABS8HN89_9FIRM|nr:hypothetical protein [Pelosinus baikalensis]MCC5464009.1 hypothetical protein [Pelosinus baikalensis]